MVRQRKNSAASNTSSMPDRDQELGSMYDYLAKVILLGPSGSGKSCLLHRFVKSEWRVLTSQTIGVEFASKIIRVGTGSRRQRIKLQLWDTAGTERFRSVSRSYYRGAAGAILVYDISSRTSFNGLPTFLNDARALASPNLTVLLAGNKSDVDTTPSVPPTPNLLDDDLISARDGMEPPSIPATPSKQPQFFNLPNISTTTLGLGARQTTTISSREVPALTAHTYSSAAGIPVAVEVSAFSGEGVNELFERLALIILTKIELGEIDPDDPNSGIQYGDSWDGGDGISVRSGVSSNDLGGLRKRGKRRGTLGTTGWREWEDVFRLDGRRRRGAGCYC